MPKQPERAERLNSVVTYLASDALCGREAGSEYSKMARQYLKACYEDIGLEPLWDSLTVPFLKYANLEGVIRSSNPSAEDKYIVLGAHFDHIGKNDDGKICHGADDNASGSALLLEIARELMLRRDELGCNVIIAAFDAEELGLFGSNSLSNRLCVSGDASSIKLMVSMDMVGWYRQSGSLHMIGTGTLKLKDSFYKSLAEECGITLQLKDYETSLLTATDTRAFAMEGIPTLDVTTGLKSPYHKPEDTSDKIDYEGLDRIASYLSNLFVSLSEAEKTVSSGRISKIHRRHTVKAGIGVGMGSTCINYTGSSVITRSSFTPALDMSLKFNISEYLALQTGAAYEFGRSKFPVQGSELSLSTSYTHQAIRIPAIIYLQTDGNSPFMLGAGAYASCILSTTTGNGAVLNPHKWQYGYCVSLAQELEGTISISLDLYNSLAPLYSAAPNSRWSATMFTVRYFLR